jgi:hypothetical protein
MNILGKLTTSIENFTQPISLVTVSSPSGLRKLQNTGGWKYSQKETIDDITLVCASKFKTGDIDEQGQQKLYLNTSTFGRDVAVKNTDLDVKNFVFKPETRADKATSYLTSKRFSNWAKKKELGITINEIGDDVPTYGSGVIKKCGDEIERVPLQALINSPTAPSLEEAVEMDGYVIQVHELSYYQAKEYKDWKIEKMYDGVKVYYEMYALIPRYALTEEKASFVSEGDREEKVWSMSVLSDGKVVYCTEIDEEDFPFEETHWERVVGRWLGRGVIESSFENQKAMNMIANLQKRGMLWSSKRIFQTQGDTAGKNLIKNVSDGQVLEVGPNGLITQVNSSTQALPDYNSGMNMWGENLKQKTFTFEVATGESMPSATPFRLGVILSDAAASYFERKRENIGMFWARVFWEQVVPIFKKEIEDEHVYIESGDTGYNMLFENVLQNYTNKFYIDMMKSPEITHIPTYDEVQQMITKKIDGMLMFKVLKEDMDKLQDKLILDLTGESRDFKGEDATLTNMYQTMLQSGDPRAEFFLEEIALRNNMVLPPKQQMQGGASPQQTPQASAINNTTTPQQASVAQTIG